LKKKRKYNGITVSIDVYDLVIENRKIKREIIEHPGASAILAFEGKNILLVKQYRFPHGYILEIPAGTLEKNETPEECAFREIREETGYAAKKMKHLLTYFPSVGYNKEAIHCYIASGLKKSGDLQLDHDEIMSVVKMDFNKLVRMIIAGKIIDSKTICAVLTYAAKKNLL